MSPEQQRIAIAEARGWKWIGSPEQVAATIGFTMPDKWVIDPNNRLQFPHNAPDYLNDLNAMHEAEKAAFGNAWDEEPWARYKQNLYGVIEMHRHILNATAAQRAEAFLRTIGKWEDAQ